MLREGENSAEVKGEMVFEEGSVVVVAMVVVVAAEEAEVTMVVSFWPSGEKRE